MEFSCASIRLITNPGLPWIILYLELNVLPPGKQTRTFGHPDYGRPTNQH